MQAQIEHIEIPKGGALNYAWDYSVIEENLGASVSTVAWSTDQSSTVAISGEALASSVASALLTGSNEGNAVIKITATMDDSQIIVTYFDVNVRDYTV